MVKNNVKALLIHIVLSFCFIYVYLAFNSSAVKWNSEQAEKNYHNSIFVISIVMLIIALFLYYYFSKKLLSKQKNIVSNLISVSFISILGVIFWITAYSINPPAPGGNLISSNLWFYYSIYNSYCIMAFDSLQINNQYLFLVASFVPSILMTIGLISIKKSPNGKLK